MRRLLTSLSAALASLTCRRRRRRRRLPQAIVAELTKLGASVEEGHDYCVITPPKEASFFLGFRARV